MYDVGCHVFFWNSNFEIGNDIFQSFLLLFLQRGERKKWISCFDQVTAILFLASLNEYDQVFEDGDEDGVVHWRGWCGTLSMLLWYFEKGDVVLWRGWCRTLNMVF